jgi:hypothetical protein
MHHAWWHTLVLFSSCISLFACGKEQYRRGRLRDVLRADLKVRDPRAVGWRREELLHGHLARCSRGTRWSLNAIQWSLNVEVSEIDSFSILATPISFSHHYCYHHNYCCYHYHCWFGASIANDNICNHIYDNDWHIQSTVDHIICDHNRKNAWTKMHEQWIK